jgi:C4-dicarboxylate-specific signal transduction histidine kinase
MLKLITSRISAEKRVLGFFAFIQDVTDRRRADAESQRLRDQLAHVSRVASMGELTATVAHELNQPLSAILSNAQAALRELSREDPRLDGVRSALTDIVGRRQASRRGYQADQIFPTANRRKTRDCGYQYNH